MGERTKPASILIVDDDEAIRCITAEFFRDCGFEVIEAEDAHEARTCFYAHQGKFSLMITDVIMPGDMDGIELAQWVSRHFPATAILVMSGYTGGESVGFPFVQKPFTLGRVAEIAGRLIGRSRVLS